MKIVLGTIERAFHSFINKSVMLIAWFFLSCSIHVGNPKDSEGNPDQKLTAEVSLMISGYGFDSDERLELNIDRIIFKSADHALDNEIKGQLHYDLKLMKSNEWQTFIINDESIAASKYTEIEIVFNDSEHGFFYKDNQPYSIYFENGSNSYSIPVTITLATVDKTLIDLSFSTENSIESIKSDGKVTGYLFKNAFTVYQRNRNPLRKKL